MEQAIVAGVVVVLVWRERFLLILRDNKPDILFPGTWSCVTGGRREDEDLERTALRELKEEIGLIPRDLAPPLGISRKGNMFFFGRLSDEEKERICLGEGQRFDFFSYEELSNLEVAGATKVYLEKYPDVFQRMAETGLPPFGSELGLATWNGKL